MESGDSLRAFTAKWHAAWPEQDVLAVFVPAGQRELVSAWGALLSELHESLFSLEHDAVRQAKSAWWMQELLAMSDRSARQPLARYLQERNAPFSTMAAQMSELAALVPVKAARTDALFRILTPFAQTAAACEAALLGTRSGAADAQSIIGQWLSMRMPHGLAAFDRAMVPMHLLARHTDLADTGTANAMRRDWLRELQDVLELQQPENWYRRAQLRFTLRRIAAYTHRDSPKIGPGHAWDAWRSVRSGLRA
jgi:hypothetical protein